MKLVYALVSVLLLSTTSTDLTFINPINDGNIISDFDEIKGIKSITIRPENLLIDNEVIASEDGVVILIDTRPDNSYVVVIQHADNYQTMYSGLSNVDVKLDDTIKQGSTIGSLGDRTRLSFVIIKDGIRLENTSSLIE